MCFSNIIYLFCISHLSVLGSLINSKCSNSDLNFRNELICQDFGNFAQITFANNDTKFNSIESITIKPNKKLVLDNSFEWSGFDLSNEYSEIKVINL